MMSDFRERRREINGWSEILRRSDLERLVMPQVDRYIALGFHREVYPGLDQEQASALYRNDCAIPEEMQWPLGYDVNLFDIVLLVEPRVFLTEQHRLAGRIKELGLEPVANTWGTSQVTEVINTEKIYDLTDHPKDVPYVVFARYEEELTRSSRGGILLPPVNDSRFNSWCPQLEVTGLFLQRPDLFVKLGMIALGSLYGTGRGNVYPCFGVSSDEPIILALIGEQMHLRRWNKLSRARGVITLGARGRTISTSTLF